MVFINPLLVNNDRFNYAFGYCIFDNGKKFAKKNNATALGDSIKFFKQHQ